MNLTNKLYLVTLRNYGNESTHYVVAKNPDDAYKKIRDFLDEKDWCFSYER